MKKQARKPTKMVKKASTKAPRAMARGNTRPTARNRAAGKSASGIAALEKRLRTLEDILEITELKAAYCNYADGGWDRLTHDYDGIASLFVEDGIWDGGRVGRGDGREGIRAMFKAIRNIPFAFHRVTNPIIKVNGDTAIGNWHVLVPLTQPDGQSYWVTGIYNDEFVRTPDGWKFKILSWKPAFITPFEKPWGRGEFYQRQSAPTEDGGEKYSEES